MNSSEFSPDWLANGIPFDENGVPKKCMRYKFSHYNESDDSSAFCPATYFNQSVMDLDCKEFVYKTDEETILSEVIQLAHETMDSFLKR